jgi:hypothetical protein
MLTRRALLAGFGAVATSCRSRERGADQVEAIPRASTPDAPTLVASASASASAPAPVTAPPGSLRVDARTIAFDARSGGPQQAVIVTPSWSGETAARRPLLVALGGLGETRRGIAAGAWAWMKDYWLERAMKRLAAPPLTSADFQELVEPARLEAMNASLAVRPFRGVVVACPFTPDLITPRSLTNAGAFARFIASNLLPRVRAEASVDDARAATGIDGVSLGGRLALLVALEQAEAFGSVGVMQGAFEVDEVPEVAQRTASFMRRGSVRLRIMTSDRDFYREAIEALHEALAGAGAAHDHLLLPGPHAYAWNRGPGAIEMLLWHDRVLRGEAPDP